jgi:2'-5' RNA ligase
VRLFAALWPPEYAVAGLQQAVDDLDLPPEARPVPPQRWHLTLCFYGNRADPDERAAFLATRLAGLSAPTLQLSGAGTFGQVLWVGVQPVSDADREVLAAIAAAAGATERFHPHVTVARWRRGRPRRAVSQRLAGFSGPVWTAAEVALVRSVPGAGGSTYSTLHRVPLVGW